KGTAFFSKDELQAYLQLLEEAKKRDHRKLGRELDLFMHHEWAPGETIWLDRGNRMYRILTRMMSDLCREEGYQEVFSPMLFKKDLFETSGHWRHYRDDMFIVPGQEAEPMTEKQLEDFAAANAPLESTVPAHELKVFEADYTKAGSTGEKLSLLLGRSPTFATKHWNLFEKHPGEFVRLTGNEREILALKPMNCPCHMLIFRDRKRSYRELPLRLHDQGVLHRNEASGTLSGLTRVRQFCQDDAHIFLAQEQIEGEITALIGLVRRVYKTFGMDFAKVFLSTRPDDFLGKKETWDTAEQALENAIRANEMEYTINEGDGAFYGPKIDFIVRDCLNREWQTATIQLDYQLPARFGLKFINRDNAEEMPVVVHRAIFGSFERFMAILIEHFGGNFPTWLAPEQVRILTISEKFEEYADKVFLDLQLLGVRVEKDYSAEKIGSKIREGRMMRIPYLVIVGEKEMENGAVSVRSQTEGELGSMALGDFVERLKGEMEARF
ncbi:MAG: threonine--tRNA ligase, partial [Candidatus Sumerlaeia bacterium]|nr:threonine--tRNA ligase [Candidatus Sumerlaeia bacterium]